MAMALAMATAMGRARVGRAQFERAIDYDYRVCAEQPGEYATTAGGRDDGGAGVVRVARRGRAGILRGDRVRRVRAHESAVDAG